MKIERLELYKFGAFPNAVEIDFEKINSKGLFLITGPTGSGKSTILDAICYALYGDISSKRTDDEMNSHHNKDANKKGYVVLHFSFAGRKYIVSRELPTRSAKGNRSLGEESLRIFDTQGNELELPITGRKEVTAKIASLLGMTLDEFTKVVLLPQGDFQKFLLESNDEREVILGKLFRAEIYKKLTEQLKLAERESRKKLDSSKTELNTLLESSSVSSSHHLEERISEEEALIPLLERTFIGREKKLNEATKSLNSAEKLAVDFDKYSEAVESLDTHNYSIDEYENRKAQLVLVEKSVKEKQSLVQLDSLTSKLKSVEQQLLDNSKKLQIRAEVYERLKQRFIIESDKKDEYLKKNTTLESYKKLIPEYSVLETKTNEFALGEANAKSIVTKLENAKKGLKLFQDEESDLKLRLPSLQNAVLQKGRIESELSSIRRVLTVAESVNQLNLEVAKAKDNSKVLIQRYDRLLNDKAAKSINYTSLEASWRNSAAARMALLLDDNTPCPVCGSVNHPNPAKKDDTYVDTKVLDSVKVELTELEQVLTDLREKVESNSNSIASLESSILAYNEQLGIYANHPLVSIRQLVEQKNKEFVEITKLETEFEKVNSRLSDLEKLSRAKQDELEVLNKEHREIELNLAGLKSSIESILSKLPKDIIDISILQKVISAIEKEILDYSTLVQQLQTEKENAEREVNLLQGEVKSDEKKFAELGADCTKALGEFETILAKLGFESRVEYEQHLLSDTQIERIRAFVDNWLHKQVELKALVDVAFELVKGKQRPDIESLANEKGTLELEVQKLREEKTIKEHTVNSFRGALEQIVLKEQNCKKCEDEYLEVKYLSDLAKGENEISQPLSSFVLAVFLDEVLLAANKRLCEFTRDRYELQRGEVSRKGNRRTGLDLVILDSYTGIERKPHSLSGGEMFLTSLSLALGLSDVVLSQTSAGNLESMFIDEGFGSLDDQTLDVALNTLSKLQDDGRTIGIISHVQELKERIPVKLYVNKGKSGSSIAYTEK